MIKEDDFREKLYFALDAKKKMEEAVMAEKEAQKEMQKEVQNLLAEKEMLLATISAGMEEIDRQIDGLKKEGNKTKEIESLMDQKKELESQKRGICRIFGHEILSSTYIPAVFVDKKQLRVCQCCGKMVTYSECVEKSKNATFPVFSYKLLET